MNYHSRCKNILYFYNYNNKKKIRGRLQVWPFKMIFHRSIKSLPCVEMHQSYDMNLIYLKIVVLEYITFPRKFQTSSNGASMSTARPPLLFALLSRKRKKLILPLFTLPRMDCFKDRRTSPYHNRFASYAITNK